MGKTPKMWLALAISLLFFAEAAWRFAIEGTSTPDRATAIFNGVNFVLFGLLGLGCLFWPTISSWFRPKEENKADGGDDVSVVVDRWCWTCAVQHLLWHFSCDWLYVSCHRTIRWTWWDESVAE